MSLADNRTQIQDCDATGDISGDSDAAPQSRTTESGLVIEGGSSIQFQVTNAQEHILFDLDSGGTSINRDMSDETVYIMIKDNLADTFANLGGLICLNDGLDGAGGDDIGYAVAGVDVGGLPYLKKFACYKLDVSVIVATPGTDNVDFFTYNGLEANLDQTAVRQIGYGSIHLAKGQGTIPNAWFDGIYAIANDSFAATVAGGTEGTPETMADLVGDDEAVGAGMFSNPIGSSYYIFAPTEWGDSGTATTGFAGTDEQWFFLGDNGGGHSVGVGHFPMRLLGNSTGTNTFILTRVALINTGTPAEFDLSDANFDKVQFNGCVITDFGAITWPAANDADKFCNDTVFNNCAQMVINATNMDGNTFNGTTDPLGAILWDTAGDETNQDNLTFNSDGTGHAIEISLNTASLTTFNIDGYTVSGYETVDDGSTGNTVFIVDNALDGDVDINVTNGAGTFSYERAAGYTGTVNVIQSVTLTVQVNDSDGNGISGARVRIETSPGGTLVSEGSTDGTGEFTDSYTGSTPQVVLLKVRLKGFKPFRTTGTISGTGFTATATMTTDRIVDLP